jgi:hypothetical protein
MAGLPDRRQSNRTQVVHHQSKHAPFRPTDQFRGRLGEIARNQLRLRLLCIISSRTLERTGWKGAHGQELRYRSLRRVKGPDGEFLSAGVTDAFGHAQLGGVAPIVTNLISEKLGNKCHWAVADYLQRSARHIASETDVQQAYAVGRAAVEFAIAGKNGVMPAIRRLSDSPYCWDIMEVPLSEVANREKLLPPEFISADGFGITAAARRYLAPLIAGEAYSPFKDGLPDYVRLQNVATPKKLVKKFAV